MSVGQAAAEAQAAPAAKSPAAAAARVRVTGRVTVLAESGPVSSRAVRPGPATSRLGDSQAQSLVVTAATGTPVKGSVTGTDRRRRGRRPGGSGPAGPRDWPDHGRRPGRACPGTQLAA